MESSQEKLQKKGGEGGGKEQCCFLDDFLSSLFGDSFDCQSV